MARYFLDTSVLLPRYIRARPADDAVRQRVDRLEEFATLVVSADPPAVVSSLTILEARGVLARMERSHPAVAVAKDMLDVDEAGFELWEPLSEDWARAMDLAGQHALRGADALQMAVFLRAKAKHADLFLATSDHDLVEACRKLGEPVHDPGA